MNLIDRIVGARRGTRRVDEFVESAPRRAQSLEVAELPQPIQRMYCGCAFGFDEPTLDVGARIGDVSLCEERLELHRPHLVIPRDTERGSPFLQLRAEGGRRRGVVQRTVDRKGAADPPDHRAVLMDGFGPTVDECSIRAVESACQLLKRLRDRFTCRTGNIAHRAPMVASI